MISSYKPRPKGAAQLKSVGTRLKFKMSKGSLLIIGGFVILAIAIYGPWLRVKNIVINGAETQPVADLLINKAQEQLVGRRYVLLPADSFLALDENNLDRAIKDGYAKVESMDYKFEIPSTLAINLKLKSSSTFWRSGFKYFELTDQGELIAQAATPSESDIVFSDNNSLQDYKVGDDVSIETVLNAARAIKSGVTSPTLAKIHYFDIAYIKDFELRAYTNHGWYIAFNLHEDIQNQLNKLNNFLVQKNREQPLSPASFSYIDVRFGDDRVYYK
jgi:hypothetical protein